MTITARQANFLITMIPLYRTFIEDTLKSCHYAWILFTCDSVLSSVYRSIARRKQIFDKVVSKNSIFNKHENERVVCNARLLQYQAFFKGKNRVTHCRIHKGVGGSGISREGAEAWLFLNAVAQDRYPTFLDQNRRFRQNRTFWYFWVHACILWTLT